MKRIKALIEISRPVNVVITLVVVVVSALICSSDFLISRNIILAGLSAALVAASGNIINDIIDIEIDRTNRPDRVLPSGRIKIKEAKIYYIFFVLVALFLAISISFHSLLIVAITSLLLFIYSVFLKGTPLLGNVVVSVCTALAFIYGGLVVAEVSVAIIPAIFAFQITLIRELVKDIEDFDGDKKNNVETFTVKYGVKKTKILITIFIIILIISTFYPFITHLFKVEYFIVVLFFVDLPLVYILKKNRENLNKIDLAKLSRILKLTMVAGLIAIAVGIF